MPVAKIASKGKKQSAVKKTDVNSGAENTGDKNEKTKPQVTHELSMVRPFLFFFYDIQLKKRAASLEV